MWTQLHRQNYAVFGRKNKIAHSGRDDQSCGNKRSESGKKETGSAKEDKFPNDPEEITAFGAKGTGVECSEA